MYTHYRYKLLQDNQVFRGKISGSSYAEVLNIIQATGKPIHLNRILFNFRRLALKKLVNWLDELALLLKEGISIEKALEYTAPNYDFNRSILTMIQSGIKFNKAIEYHAFFFDPISISMINVLIDSTSIESVLYFLLEYHMRTMNFREKLHRSLFFPVVTLSLSCVTMVGLIFVIKDPIITTLNQLSIDPPFFLVFMDGLRWNDIIQLVLIAVLLFIYLSRFSSELPIIRSYYYHRDLFISFYSLSKMLDSGVPILECLGIIQKLSIVRRVRKMFNTVSKEILQGESIYMSMSRYNVPKVYLNLIKMNEVVGSLSHGFLRCSKVAEGYSTNYLNSISNIVHPVIIILNTLMIICFLNLVIFPIYNSCTGFVG